MAGADPWPVLVCACPGAVVLPGVVLVVVCFAIVLVVMCVQRYKLGGFVVLVPCPRGLG